MSDEKTELRSLVQVVDRLLAIIPENETDFRDELEKARSSASFAPPELQYLHWRRAGYAFGERFPLDVEPTEEWAREACAIYLGRK